MLDENDYKEIEKIINSKITSINDEIKTLNINTLKVQIFNIENYNIEEFNNNSSNRFYHFSSTLVPEIINAFTSNHFIILEYKNNYWFLNSFLKDNTNNRYNISFFNTQLNKYDENNNNVIFTTLQFCILEYNPNAIENNTTFKATNKIRISDEIVTKNTVYNNETKDG